MDNVDHEFAEIMIRIAGKTIGYGRAMQVAQEAWRKDLENMFGSGGGAFSIGPCIQMLVRCDHLIEDENGHCKVCCGSGRVTAWVAEAARQLKKGKS